MPFFQSSKIQLALLENRYGHAMFLVSGPGNLAISYNSNPTRFREWSMSKHWLPPSLLPLLKILIYEHKNQLEDQKRRDAEYLSEKSKADTKIAKLEKQLQSSSARIQEIDCDKREELSAYEPKDYQEMKVLNVELQKTVEQLREKLSQLSLPGKISVSSDTIDPTEEYTEVPQIYFQNSFETERRLSLDKLSGPSNVVAVESEEPEESGSSYDNNELNNPPDSHPPSRRAHFAAEDSLETNPVPNYEPENISSPTAHLNQQRNKRDISREEQGNQISRPSLADNDLVDSEEVDGMTLLKTTDPTEQERAASTHSKDSMQAREEFYRDLQLGVQALSFDKNMLGKSPEEGLDEEEEEEGRSSTHSTLSSSVEDSELPESRPLSQDKSSPDTPRPAPDQIEDIDSATPQDDDIYNGLDVHSSDEEHDHENNFEQMNKVYDELESRRKREESTNLITATSTAKLEEDDSVNQNSIHSQVSQSSMETIKEVPPEDWGNMACREDGCCILPTRDSAPLEKAESIKDDKSGSQTSIASAPHNGQDSPSHRSEEGDEGKMDNGILLNSEDKLDKCPVGNIENVYESEFMLPQSSSSRKILSQHHNNAIQFWHLASILARMLRVDIPLHNSPDSLEHSINSPNLEEDKSINYQEIELRQTAVNSIIEKLELLLDNLRSSAGVGNHTVDSEDSGHCNSSSTTDGSKHELGQTTM
uniref:Uncharacterized protein n=1 Tax=Ditylenchus dipsaci TaxID=166011 RepID=A0A915DX81_9BILA